MKPFYFLAVLIVCLYSSNITAQTSYNSSITTKYKLDSEIIKKPRTITISDSIITISDFIGETKPLIINIDKIEEVEDDWDGLMKWYYGKSVDENPFTGEKTSFIVIMKKSYPSEIEINQKIDEVTYIKTVMTLK